MSRTPRTFCPALSIPSVSNPAGRTLTDSDREAQALCDRQLRLVGHTICSEHLAAFSLIMGTPRSGKTLAQKLFMASLLSDGEDGITYRAAVFDPKNELYAFFKNMGIAEKHIMIANPYDKRCVAWHLPDDFAGSDDAQTFANCLFPLRPKTTDKRHPDFWQNASNDILHKVLMALMNMLPDSWELRDLTEVCGYEETIAQTLHKTRRGKRAYSAYLERSKHKDLPGSVLATLRTKMGQFEELGMLLHNREAVFSIKKWREGSGIILLGHDTKHAEQLGTLNNLLMKQMSVTVCGPEWPEEPVDHTWFLLDEFVEAGEFDGFRTLLNFGRTKGVRVMLGFCDKSGLEETFEQSKSILALCDNYVFFHLGSAETAEWASKQCGIVEKLLVSTNTSPQGEVSQQAHFGLHHNVLPVEFQDLPLAEGGTLQGFCLVPGNTVFETGLTGDEVDHNLPPKTPDDKKHAYLKRPQKDQDEKPWTRAEFKEAGLKPPPDFEFVRDDHMPPPKIFVP